MKLRNFYITAFLLIIAMYASAATADTLVGWALETQFDNYKPFMSYFQDGNILNFMIAICCAALLFHFRKRIPQKVMNFSVSCVSVIGVLAVILMLSGDGYVGAGFWGSLITLGFGWFVVCILLPILLIYWILQIIIHKENKFSFWAIIRQIIPAFAAIPLGLLAGSFLFGVNQEISKSVNIQICEAYVRSHDYNSYGVRTLMEQWEREHLLQWGADAERHYRPYVPIDTVAHPQ